MLPTYRNPMQVRTLDDVTLRREMKQLLDATLILDEAEQRELLDLSNGGGRACALRLAVLRQGLYGNGGPRLLNPQERTALAVYVLGQGPRPRFTRLASSEGHYGPSYLAADDPDAPKPGPDWPAQDPREPGRYVLPKGRFADAAPDDRWPATS